MSQPGVKETDSPVAFTASSRSSTSELIESLTEKGVVVQAARDLAEIRRMIVDSPGPAVVAVQFELPRQSLELCDLVAEVGLVAMVPEPDGCTVFLNTLDATTDAASGGIAARLEAAVRASRSTFGGNLVSSDGRIVCDARRQLLVKDDAALPLSIAEWEILSCLAEQPLRIWTREEILLKTTRGHSTWAAELPSVRTVDAHVKNIRRKLELEPHHPQYLLTARQRGYYLNGFEIR